MYAGILHTIMFHRALGLVRPKERDLELFEITYVCVFFTQSVAYYYVSCEVSKIMFLMNPFFFLSYIANHDFA